MIVSIEHITPQETQANNPGTRAINRKNNAFLENPDVEGFDDKEKAILSRNGRCHERLKTEHEMMKKEHRLMNDEHYRIIDHSSDNLYRPIEIKKGNLPGFLFSCYI